MVKFKNTNTNTGRTFECTLTCTQCTARTATGSRCRRRVCIGTKNCFTHRRRDEGLMVKRSNIAKAGKGLFATKTFRKNDKIGSYRGEVISRAQLNNRYGQGEDANAPYALSARNSQRLLDAGCERGLLSIANSGRTRAQCNARYSEQMKQDRTINVFATKRINAGDEILIWYGPGYWASAGNSRHTTK